jgi:sugar lactone lactonase YvrE
VLDFVFFEDIQPATLGELYEGYTIGAIGGGSSYSWTIVNGTLPPGMQFVASSSFATIIGTPRKENKNYPVEYPFTIRLASSFEVIEVSLKLKVMPSVVVSTLAGSGNSTFADGQGTAASFSNPTGIAVDLTGNVYVVGSETRIRKITPSGNVTTLAGSGVAGFADGQGSSASFNGTCDVAVDRNGNLYVADMNRIRKITPSGTVSTLAGSGTPAYADGQGTSASFDHPIGVAVDQGGNVYVADFGNNRIRKISSSGNVTTLAGSGIWGYADGQGASASFSGPLGLAIDANGIVYVGETGGRIRKITPSGFVTTLAGSGANSGGPLNGQGTQASFSMPNGLAVDVYGNVYVADNWFHLIRKINPSGNVTTLAGGWVDEFMSGGYADGQANLALFNFPSKVAVDLNGNIYVTDSGNNRIRKITISQ